MAKLTKDEFISALKEMTVLEVKELVDAMKEELGVDPSAVAVAAAPAAAVEETQVLKQSYLKMQELLKSVLSKLLEKLPV